MAIKQIKDSAGVAHDLDAKLWDGHSYSELTSMVHGVVDTYVIAAQTAGSETDAYKAVVQSTAAQCSTTESNLNILTGASSTNTYKVGDIVLMGATSTGTHTFDRWVSKISGTTVYLDVLETQVATHTHNVTTGSAKALTGVSATNSTTANVAKVGSAVSVVTSGTGVVVTGVAYNGTGSNTMKIESVSSGGVGHSHTVNGHTHSITLGQTALVSQKANAFTSLVSVSLTPHTHGNNVNVAGTPSNSTSFKYVSGGSTATFIKTLKDSDDIATGENTTATSTGEQTLTTKEASTTTTGANGGHNHTLSSAQTDTLVTGATVAEKVITNVTIANNTSVAANVVTSVTKVSKTVVTSAALTGVKTFVSTITVDASGVLSFNTASVGISAPTETVSCVNSITSATQSTGAPTLTLSYASQSVTTGKVAVSGTTTSVASHTHSFSHTHSIDSHTHSIAAHTHTYKKSVTDGTGNAYTSLTSANYTPHTHGNNVSVAGSRTDGTAITVVTSGTTTQVVRNLVTDKAFTSTSSAPETNEKQYKLSGDITCPALSVTLVSTHTLLSRDSITPADDGGAKAITSITFTSANFINSVTKKTSTNNGGN